MKKILLATLGESPAVVTEAIDRLQADGIDIEPVIVLTTKVYHLSVATGR